MAKGCLTYGVTNIINVLEYNFTVFMEYKNSECIIHVNQHCVLYRFFKKNMLMWGIWLGKGKPPFHVYFEPFASEMVHLFDEGMIKNYYTCPVMITEMWVKGCRMAVKSHIHCVYKFNFSTIINYNVSCEYMLCVSVSRYSLSGALYEN